MYPCDWKAIIVASWRVSQHAGRATVGAPLVPRSLASILLVAVRPDRNIGETRRVAMVIKGVKVLD